MTRIDRRALFSTGSAAALLAATGVSAGPVPRRGGKLRAALSGGLRGETITEGRGLFSQIVRLAVFETLTERAPDGTLQPGLASEWRSTENGLNWHFHLRSDVLLHDGSPLTNDDVAASLAGRGLDVRIAAGVSISLDHPDPAFPFRLSLPEYVIFQNDEVQSGKTPANGTGLYQMQRFEPGRGFLGKRITDHRKNGRVGWVDEVEIVAIDDTQARVHAVRDGIVDLADVPPDYVCEQLRSVNFEAGRALVGQNVCFAKRQGIGLLDDHRFPERWWVSI